MDNNQNTSAEKKLIDLLFISKYKQLEETAIEIEWAKQNGLKHIADAWEKDYFRQNSSNNP